MVRQGELDFSNKELSLLSLDAKSKVYSGMTSLIKEFQSVTFV